MGTGRRRTRWWIGLLVTGLVGLPCLAVRDETARAAVLATLAWADTFVRSPGLGGAAAVGAAVIGLARWRRQSDEESSRRDERERSDRTARRDQQWWDVYRLARADRPPAPCHLHEDEEVLLRTLVAHAETEVQTAAARALVAAYVPGPTTAPRRGTP